MKKNSISYTNDIIRLRPEEVKTIKRFSAFYRTENNYPILTQSDIYRGIFYVLFNKYNIPFTGNYTMPESAYDALKKVADSNIDYYQDTKSGTRQLIIRTDSSFKESVCLLKRDLGVFTTCSIVRCFLNNLEKYLDSVGA